MAETKNTVSVNFRCTPELKRSIEILTLVNRKKDVSTFITDLISQVIEVNRNVINAVNAAEFVSPFATDKNDAPKKKSGTKKKKPTAQVETSPPDTAADESVGGDNAEN